MTSYLASELNIYGIILDTIEPVLAKRKAASDAEEAKKKADDKEARTQHIEVHVKKDDE
jgi:SOS response regulatory protein OraA/RecX